MKHLFTSFQSFRKAFFLLAIMLLAISSNVFGQSYNSGSKTWCAMYDGTEYTQSTSATAVIHTYTNIFRPHAGTFSFETQLPGKESAQWGCGKTQSAIRKIGDDDEIYWMSGVEDYQMNFGNITNIYVPNGIHYTQRYVNHQFAAQEWCLWFDFTYNYKTVSGQGLDPNIASIDVTYLYTLDEYEVNRNKDRTIYIRNVQVPLAKHILLHDPYNTLGTTAVSHNFGELYVGNTTDAYEVKFRSFLTSSNANCGNISIRLTSGDPEVFRLGSPDNTTGTLETSTYGNTYNVGQNACASTNGWSDYCTTSWLAKIDNYSFRVYFYPKANASYGGTVTITDGENTATVTLAGVGRQLTPTVDWSSANSTFYVEDVLSASNNNQLPVTLSSAGNENYIACRDARAVMLAATPGDITINAHVTGNGMYSDADYQKTIRIVGKQPQTISWGATPDLSSLRTTDPNRSVTLGAIASSGMPVTYRLAGENIPAGLAVQQSGDAYTLVYPAEACKNITLIASQAGSADYAPAPDLSMPVRVADPTQVCDADEVLVNAPVRLKAAQTYYNISVPSAMTIAVQRSNTDWYASYAGQALKVEFYSEPGGLGTLLASQRYEPESIQNANTFTISGLGEAIKSVKFISEATYGYDITSVTYTKHRYCTISVDAIPFEVAPTRTSDAKTLQVRYANYPLTVECSNPKFALNATDFGDCNEYGEQTITVTYTAGAEEGNDTGILSVKDNTGAVLQTCNLTAAVAKLPQKITSHNVTSAYLTTDKVQLTAAAESGLTEFAFTAQPEGIVAFNGAEMTFVRAGTVTIVVSQPGDVTYLPCSDTIRDVVVSKVTPAIAANPDVAELRYLDNQADDQLSGGKATVTLHGVEDTEVAGVFRWTNPGQITDASGVHDYPVTFLPTDEGMYNSTEITLSVTILPAVSDIVMADSALIVSIPEHQQALDLSLLIRSETGDGAVTCEVTSTNAESATISDGIFSAAAAGEYTLLAVKAATAYYDKAEDEFVLRVDKRTPNVSLEQLGTVTLTYGDTLASKAFVGNVLITDYSSDNSEPASETCTWIDGDLMPVVGVTSAQAIFTSLHTEWFEPVEIVVPIAVNPASASSYVATATIVEGQTLGEVEFVNATVGLFNDSVAGTFSWPTEADLTAVPQSGTHELPVRFASDNANYLSSDNAVCILTVDPGYMFDGSDGNDWESWLDEAGLTGDERITVNADVPIRGKVNVAGLTVNEGQTVTVQDGGVLTIGNLNSLERDTYGSIVVEEGGTLVLGEGEVHLSSFTLVSGFDADGQPLAGQVLNNSQIIVHGDAFFVIDMNTSDLTPGRYEFTVPFPVDALNGIERWNGSEWETMTNGVDCTVLAFDEAAAAQGQDGWTPYSGILQPGVGYSIIITGQMPTFRFRMADLATFTDNMILMLRASGTGDEWNIGWNNIGNGSMQNVSLYAPAGVVQILERGTNAYRLVDLVEEQVAFVVGATFFVQAYEDNIPLMMDPADESLPVLRAPQSIADEPASRFSLNLKQGNNTIDRLIVNYDNQAPADYTRTWDVMKLGDTEGALIARIWTNAKGTDLCVISTALTEDRVIVPLSIFVPEAGEYTLSLNIQPGEEVYLRRDGILVWDFQTGDYTADFAAGTDRSYDLLVGNPETALYMLDADGNRSGVHKFINHGRLFLLRDGILYDAQGQSVATPAR